MKTSKRQKKFQKAVDKKAKKIVTSATKAEEASNETFTARIDATIKTHGTSSEISVTVVIKKRKIRRKRKPQNIRGLLSYHLL